MFALAPVTADKHTLKTRGLRSRLEGAMKGLSSFADWVDGEQSSERRASPSDTVSEALLWYLGREASAK
jgi:hypothetical protein